MTVCASIVEVHRSGETAGRGEYEFLQLPAPGDRIVIGNAHGALDILRVLYVEHSPVAIPRSPMARPDARASVFVEWLDDYDGEDDFGE
jgi:hypothetical protein